MTFSFENAGRAPQPNRKAYITRMAVLWSLFTAACTALVIVALVNIVSGNTGYVVMLGVFGLIGGNGAAPEVGCLALCFRPRSWSWSWSRGGRRA